MKRTLIILGLFISIIANAQWQLSNLDTIEVTAIACKDSLVFVASHSGGVYSSVDNGNTWIYSSVGLPVHEAVRSLAIGGGSIFAGTIHSGMYLSSDNGISWAQINSGLTDSTVYTIVSDGTNVFVGTYHNGVYRYSNNGGLWNALQVGLTNHRIYSLAISDTIIYAGSDSGNVYVSQFNSNQWMLINTGLPIKPILSIAVKGNTIFSGTPNGVYVTANNGVLWNQSNAGLQNHNFIHSIVIEGNNVLVGTDSGVYISYTNGSQWVDLNMGVNGVAQSDITSIAVGSLNIFIVVPIPVSIDNLWYLPIDEITGVKKLSSINHFTIYPNPSMGIIKLESDKLKIEKLEVYNFTGEKVFQQSGYNHQAKNEIDLSFLSKSVYLVRVYDSNSCYDKKIVIQ